MGEGSPNILGCALEGSHWVHQFHFSEEKLRLSRFSGQPFHKKLRTLVQFPSMPMSGWEVDFCPDDRDDDIKPTGNNNSDDSSRYMCMPLEMTDSIFGIKGACVTT